VRGRGSGSGSSTFGVEYDDDESGGMALKAARADAVGWASDQVAGYCTVVQAWGRHNLLSMARGGSQFRPCLLSGASFALHGRRVDSLSAGRSHTLAVCSDGTVFAWGAGGHGRLGTGSRGDAPAPVEIRALAGRRVFLVSAGGEHSLAVAGDGSVFAWGSDQFGQLGRGGSASGTDLLSPRRL